MTKTLLSVMLCCCCSIMAFGQNMTQEIEKIIKGKQASVGVAIIHNDDIIAIANEDKYPTMSVFKFHIAVTALKKMEAENIPLDKMVYIKQKEMLKNTYSPLRDKYPDQGIRISYRDIIKYTVSISDNNTCDWLIRFVGGIDKVDSYIKSLGIKDMNFTETEESMHTDIMLCYNNWSTPLAIAQLLKKLHTENILTKEHFAFLETDQGIRISYRDIIKYTVSISDNNTCDWLIRFVGGIDKVDSYIKSLGIKDMNFTETEESMHTDIMLCYNNWSTPLAIAQLLKKLHTENILTKEHFAFLETAMLDCVSGKNKLIAGLPTDIKFGHKTGRSNRTADGIQISEGDAGVIYLPNGEKCYIVVLIKDSRESDDDNAKIMADISNIVYRHLNK